MIASLSPFSVCEIDIPYRDDQVAEWGPSFARWSREKIGEVFSTLFDNLINNTITYMVCYSSHFISLGSS
jgi:hypothetical protein